ncbi:holin family protein [Primorskyibacter sp. S87]|uniref:holin family protein n=1 Tax=Primorskyibacter sp. S87 TaxID=3415126 RepID=UPI003C7E8E90
MGMIAGLFDLLFGGGRNLVRETAEVFVENSEAEAQRAHDAGNAALQQFAAEFARSQTTGFDRFMDGLNRVPRPALALGTLGLFVAAMADPVWFAERMHGIALVPEPLWWLLGVIVSFYFGSRHQRKSQEFQRDIAATLSRTPQVVRGLSDLRSRTAQSPGAAGSGTEANLTLAAMEPEPNPALEAWRRKRSA